MKTRLTALVCGICLLGCVQCGGPGEARRSVEVAATNVVLVFVDTLRADRLGCYGYSAPTSPVVDRLAADGAVFANAYATAPWTYPSAASLVTSLYPAAHGAFISGEIRNELTMRYPNMLSEAYTTLPEVLERHQVSTGLVAANDYLSWGVQQGFDYFSLARRNAADQTRLAMDWLAGLPEQQRFFLLVHYIDVHEPNLPPPRHRERFEHARDLSEEELERHSRWRRDFGRPDVWNTPEFRSFRDRRTALYDASIRYVDEQVGRLIAFVEETRPGQETAIIFTSDHGEEFWDHAALEHEIYQDPRDQYGMGHGHSLFQELVRIPLVVHWKDRLPARAVDSPASLVDLMPTVLDLMHVPYDGAQQGESLLPAIQGEQVASRPLLVDQLCFGRNKTGLVDRNLKLIHSDHEPSLLLDLFRDPLEQNNLLEARPDEGRRLEQLLEEMVAQSEHLGTELRGGEEVEEVDEIDPQQLENLKALGYVE